MGSGELTTPMAFPTLWSREDQLHRVQQSGDEWDVLVVGGGATGVGIALDAAARGYRTVLCEQHDFGKGTSSRSTKLIHGGVRYLEQGNIALVRDALRERGRLRQNAPHVVYPLPTVLPFYKWWEPLYYRTGLMAYDLLAGRHRLGKSVRLSPAEVLAELPSLRSDDLRGGVRYFDAAFDDARLLINLVQTAITQGAVCLNYARVAGLIQSGTRVAGAIVEDVESGEKIEILARVVINAAGPFSDSVRRLDLSSLEPIISFSQGIHIVLDRDFVPGNSAMIVPKTSDGRVVFAIPWQDHTLVGTTDVPLAHADLEPLATEEEIDFLLATVSEYFTSQPTRDDILSTFAGIRPLVKADRSAPTSKLARDHQIYVSSTGLVSIVGGKWTTYRKMAEDCVDQAIQVGQLVPAPCCTQDLPIHGSQGDPLPGHLASYGSDGPRIQQLIDDNQDLGERLDPALPYTAAEAVWAVRHELARTVEDVLARRVRALFVNAAGAVRAAPRVAQLLADERGLGQAWIDGQLDEFHRVASGYLKATHSTM